MTTAAIEIERLEVQRGGRPVLHGVSLAVPRARVTGLLGPSGCGKTTLMRAIVGVQRIRAGAVRVLGMPAGARPLRDRVGYVTQAPAIYRDLTVRENLRYFARVVDAPQARIDEVVATVALAGQADQVAGTLSGGQLARASLATALLSRPEVLVLDEPTVGVDPVLRRDLWRTLHAIADGGATLLISSHVMDEAERCDELVLMRDGRVLTSGAPAALRARTGAPDMEAVFLALVEAQGALPAPAGAREADR